MIERNKMKKTVVQLHATPNELIAFANTIKEEFGPNMVLMKFRPFKLEAIEHLSSNDMSIGDDFVFFTKYKPDINAKSQLDFFYINKGVIKLIIARLSKTELKESSLSFVSETEDEIKRARRIATKLRKLTLMGAKIIDPETKIEYKYPKHRYTEGAKELYDKGIKMLATGGGNVLELGD